MRLSERLYQMMRENRRYHPKWIAKRMGLSDGSVRQAMAELVRGGVVERHKSPNDKRVNLYETRQMSLLRLHD